jgi:hypothetical protein
MHFPSEPGISLLVEVENPIALLQHNPGDLFPVGALIEQHIQS